MQRLDIAAVDENVDLMQQVELVLRLAVAHKLFPCIAGPAPDVFRMAETLADLARERQQHAGIEQWFAAEERDALHEALRHIVHDLRLELVVVFMTGLEIPD